MPPPGRYHQRALTTAALPGSTCTPHPALRRPPGDAVFGPPSSRSVSAASRISSSLEGASPAESTSSCRCRHSGFSLTFVPALPIIVDSVQNLCTVQNQGVPWRRPPQASVCAGPWPAACVTPKTSATSCASPERRRRRLHSAATRLATLSSDGRHDVIEGSTHSTIIGEQDNAAEVGAAITDVLDTVQPPSD